MKKSAPEQQLKYSAEQIMLEAARWIDYRDNGCNDPSWADGVNMNLTRNHIKYYKREIERLCGENGFEFPAQYFIPTPPEVDRQYMASMKRDERFERLTAWGDTLKHYKIEYDCKQMSLF